MILVGENVVTLPFKLMLNVEVNSTKTAWNVDNPKQKVCSLFYCLSLLFTKISKDLQQLLASTSLQMHMLGLHLTCMWP